MQDMTQGMGLNVKFQYRTTVSLIILQLYTEPLSMVTMDVMYTFCEIWMNLSLWRGLPAHLWMWTIVLQIVRHRRRQYLVPGIKWLPFGVIVPLVFQYQAPVSALSNSRLIDNNALNSGKTTQTIKDMPLSVLGFKPWFFYCNIDNALLCVARGALEHPELV